MFSSLNSIAAAGLIFTRSLVVSPPVVIPDTSAPSSATSTRDTIPGSSPSDSTGSLYSPGGQDTVPRRRAAVQYSDAYGTRVTIHRRLSYAMVPLFALSYFTGDKLFKEGPNASSTIINLHRASATSVAALFTVNTVLGGMNLWEGRHDPADRKRKWIHAVLMVTADAGFTYAGAVLAEDAESSLSKRRAHRTVNLVSMGISTGSALFMLFGRN